MTRIAISDLEDPRVQMYRQLKSTNRTRDGRLFIAEGIRVVERLLASDFAVESLLVVERREAEWASRISPETPLYVIPQELGEQLTGFNFHVGVLACGIRRPAPPIETLLQVDRPATIVVCPNCDNPENLGAIVRIASAFGVSALLLGPGSCDPYSRRVLRVSMGTAFRLPILECTDLESVVSRLRTDWGVHLIATVADPGARPLRTVIPAPRVALLLGNEYEGLSPRWQALCDQRVTIPMHANVDSLNVAVAAGIFLHHFTPEPACDPGAETTDPAARDA